LIFFGARRGKDALTKQKKLIMWTIFITSLVHMTGLAISPAMNQMKTIAFPQHSLSEIQTALAMSGLVMPVISLLSAAAIRYGLLTKRAVVAIGFFTIGLTGILSLFLHSELWHIALFSAMTGLAAGCYLTTTFSILMDQFDMAQRQRIMGYQSVFVNTGAILLGICGGLLAVWRWYGGYLVMLAGIPAGLVAWLALPKENRKTVAGAPKKGQRSKIKPVIYYYAALGAVFMMTSVVCSGNLAVHMAASGVLNTAVVGSLASVQMVGGVLFGFVFGRFSSKLKDYMLVLAFLCLFAGMMILSFCRASILLAYIGVFIAGLAPNMMGPQCVISASEHVDESSSALASSLVNGLAPGLAGFLSPIIFTNLTNAIVRDSTSFRYQFVAIFALLSSIVVAILTHMRARKGKESLTASVCEELSQP
jgi:MFS family permease